MTLTKPIILVDDDSEDEELLMEVLVELDIKNKLVYFNNCLSAYEYLQNTTDHPFIIICDINLPIKSGIEFKRQIDENPLLRSKSIPFVFFSTSRDKYAVDTAYKEMTVQGFFQKPANYNDLKRIIKILFDYWKECIHPNT